MALTPSLADITRRGHPLPASAEGLVDRDQARGRVGARLREAVLIRQLRALGVEHVEEIHQAALVASACNVGGRLAGGRRRGSITQAVARTGVGDERILGLLQRPEYGLLVGCERRIGPRTTARHPGMHPPE